MQGNSAELGGVARPALILSLLASAALLVGCAAKKPVLYRDAHYDAVGREVAQADIADCMEIAEQEVGRDRAAAKVARNTAGGGGAGAAIGAVAGAVGRGTAGRGAATGAAVGATGGFLRGLFRSREPDPIFQRYVGLCLADRGYRVVGWR
jgi:hypothetical protein